MCGRFVSKPLMETLESDSMIALAYEFVVTCQSLRCIILDYTRERFVWDSVGRTYTLFFLLKKLL